MSTINGLPIISSIFEKYTKLPLSRNNFFETVGVAFRRYCTAVSSDHHPSSDPYLSGDTFVHIADHVLNEERSVFNGRNVRQGDIVFVNVSLLPYYFCCIHPKISKPYILISHNGDGHIDAPLTRYIDHKIIHWFAQNVAVKHPKITPIPIGLENLLYHNHGEINLFERYRQAHVIKKNRILMDFSVNTNPSIREPIYNLFKEHMLVDNLQERLSAGKYLEQLVEHKFVLSPPGNGLDCHRTWEAMYLGTIPIVEESITTRSFAALGLPLIPVKDWKKVLTWSEEKLDRLYSLTYNKSVPDPLWSSYWKAKIESHR